MWSGCHLPSSVLPLSHLSSASALLQVSCCWAEIPWGSREKYIGVQDRTRKSTGMFFQGSPEPGWFFTGKFVLAGVFQSLVVVPALQGCALFLSSLGERCLPAPCVCRVVVKVELSLKGKNRKRLTPLACLRCLREVMLLLQLLPGWSLVTVQGTLSVRVRHQNFMVQNVGVKSALVEWRVLRKPSSAPFPSGVLVPALQLVSYWFPKRLSGLT